MSNKSKTLLILAMVITVMTVLLQLINNNLVTELLSYHRDLFISQLYWQWLTPSFVHANWNHWFLNIMNFYAMGFIFYTAWSLKKIFWLFSISSFLITLGIYLFVPNINTYVGMSGVLYAFAVYGSLATFKEQKIVSVLVLTYVIAKLFFPYIVNDIIGINKILKGLYIVTEAHLYGAIVGLGFYTIKKRFYS